MSMAASPVGTSTPRTSHRPSAYGFAFEFGSAGVSADAALHAFVRIAAKPIVIPVPGVRIGPEQGMGHIWPALRSRDRSLSGRRWGDMRHVAPAVMMTRRGAFGRPGRGHSEDGARRDQQTSIVPHQALLGPRYKSRS